MPVLQDYYDTCAFGKCEGLWFYLLHETTETTENN